jgi:hypothetical protein
LIKRREAYFDLFVSGYGVEQIASHLTRVCQRSVARSVRPWRCGGSMPEDYARLQVPRLTKALSSADVSLEEGDLKAIAPFVKVVWELILYHAVNVGPARLVPPATPPDIAPTSPPLALTHSVGVAVMELFEAEKSCTKAHLSH